MSISTVTQFRSSAPPNPLQTVRRNDGFTAIDVLESLHRGGGAITFHALLPDFTDLGAVLVSDLREQWPILAPHLGRDSFFSLNAMRPQRSARSARVSQLTGLPIWSRKESNVETISALWVDIDCNRVGLTFAQCLAKFWVALDDLPDPHWIVSSGRGLWPLWEMTTTSGGHCDVQRRCLEALAKKFRHLGADPHSTDAARVMRVPLSINSKSGKSVAPYRHHPSPQRFLLTDWANLLDVSARPTKLQGESRRSGAPDPVKQAAARQRWVNGLDGFRKLWSMRGKFTKGTRRNAVWIYAFMLCRNREQEREICRLCSELGASCTPPLPESTVLEYVRLGQKSARRLLPFKNSTIVQKLAITEQERKALRRWFKPKRLLMRARQERIARRRELIRQELQADPSLSIPQLIRRLWMKAGIEASAFTVSQDRKSLAQALGLLLPSLDPKTFTPSSTEPKGGKTAAQNLRAVGKPVERVPHRCRMRVRRRACPA